MFLNTLLIIVSYKFWRNYLCSPTVTIRIGKRFYDIGKMSEGVIC